jgi:hypothetical protein
MHDRANLANGDLSHRRIENRWFARQQKNGGKQSFPSRLELKPMAEVKAIKDELVLRLARKHCKPADKWTTEHHSMLAWDFFREIGFLKGAAPEVVAKAGAQWASFYANSHMGYASNQQTHMAASGICAPRNSAESIKGEFA